MRGALWPIVLLVAAVGVGRFLERRYRLRNRTGSPWGEPDIQPGQEAMGWVLLLAGVLGAALAIAACPFRME